MSQLKQKSVAVIGGGISGMISAIELLKRGYSVTIFEKNNRLGKKLLATGNGKCNFSNENVSPKCYNDPAFFLRTVGKYGKGMVREYMKSLGIESYADSNGRVYPITNQAMSVWQALSLELDSLGATIKHGVTIIGVEPVNTFSHASKENVYLNYSPLYTHIGKDYPKVMLYHMNGIEMFDAAIFSMGSKARANVNLDDVIGKQFLADGVPSLTPINTVENTVKLDGQRVKCNMKLIYDNKEVYSEHGEVQFRKLGLSGICIFNASSFIARNYKNVKKYKVSLDLFSDISYEELYNILQKRYEIFNFSIERFFVGLLPQLLYKYVIAKLNYVSSKDINIKELTTILKNLTFSVDDLGGFEEGQVVCGGIKAEVLTDNLRLKDFSNIYACGESVNIDGVCGGYNLHWAILSGILVGESI